MEGVGGVDGVGGRLTTPRQLRSELPAPSWVVAKVGRFRRAIADVSRGKDDRLVVVVGPCSIHDAAAAHDYATRLAALAAPLANDLVVVMRVYLEKPRTTVGWKGLLNDPELTGECDIEAGLRASRRVLLDANTVGGEAMACGTEFLGATSHHFTSDLVAWGAIGARTAESQVHRELASSLLLPVGVKNGTSGDVQVGETIIVLTMTVIVLTMTVIVLTMTITGRPGTCRWERPGLH